MTDDDSSANGSDEEPAVAPTSDPLRDMNGDDDSDGSSRSIRSVPTFVLAMLAGVAGLAGSYAAVGSSSGYLLGPFASLLSDYTPAIVFRFLRNELGSTLQELLAGSMAVVFLAVGVLVALYVADRTDQSWSRIPLAAVISTALAFVATTTPLPSVAAGIGVAIVVGVGETAAALPIGKRTHTGRRRVLAGVVTAAGIGLVGRTVGSQVESGTSPMPTDDDPTLAGVDQERVQSMLDEAKRKSFDIEGMEPLVSRDFYSVDINQLDPEVDAETWSLSVTGEVAQEVTYDYEDIRNMEYEHRFVSLRCVSDSINGDAMDNALWTGVSASKLLEDADPQGNYVLLHAVDDYSVGFPLSALKQGLFAYGMNGKILPQTHGYPLRALVPGHWGETNTKWIDEIEITDEEIDGYWESRGWAGTGPVNTAAKLKSVKHPGDDRIQVAGQAYAGLRGISAVEVSTDGGDTWNEAELSEPLPGDDVWRQWRYEYESPGTSHEVVVRARDADGTLQPREKDDAYPNGATGWVSKTVEA